jgi:ubiquitin carboxyl-terminal hydrolase 25/28
LRAQKAQLEATSAEDAPALDLLDSTWQFVSSVGEEMNPDAALGDALRSRSEALRAGIQRVDDAIAASEREKAALFGAHKECAYHLSAVFMHRGHGGASGGHYWVYIRDFAAGGWRRYEDREVRPVTDLQEIYGRADPETTGAPYYVVYVRAQETAQLVDAVCRVDPAAGGEVDGAAEGRGGDTHMGGTEEPEEKMPELTALDPDRMDEDEITFVPRPAS